RGSTRRSSASRPPIPSSGTRPPSKTISCHRWRTSRRRCASCMRSRQALLYSFLFFLSGATGLIYELLWVRVLYQSFGSTIQSVTTVVAAYMGGLGLGAWLFGRRVDRTPRPAVLYGRLELAIGIFGILSPLVLGLAHWVYIGTAGALALGRAAIVLGREQSLPDPEREPGEQQTQPAPADHLRTLALVLLGLTAFASLLNEIAWTRVLIMIVGGSTYAFTLILFVFLLGIGLGSIIVARRSAPRAETAATAGLAQGV